MTSLSTHAPTLWYMFHSRLSSALRLRAALNFFLLLLLELSFDQCVSEKFSMLVVVSVKSAFHVSLFLLRRFITLCFYSVNGKDPRIVKQRQTFLVFNYNLFSHETATKLYADEKSSAFYGVDSWWSEWRGELREDMQTCLIRALEC